jgi:syntaxin 6
MISWLSYILFQIKEQDQNLDVLESSVMNLNRLSLTISSELKEQNSLLDELDRDTEHATDAIELITKKTQELVKKSGGAKYFSIIVCLTVILIILTLLVIYT